MQQGIKYILCNTVTNRLYWWGQVLQSGNVYKRCQATHRIAVIHCAQLSLSVLDFVFNFAFFTPTQTAYLIVLVYLLRTLRSCVKPRGPQQNTPTVSLGYSIHTV